MPALPAISPSELPADLGEEIVDHEGRGQAGDDHHLLHRASSVRECSPGRPPRCRAAIARWPRRPPCRRRSGRRRTTRAASVRPCTRAPTTNSTAARIITAAAPDDVGEAAGEEGADRAADQQRADGEAEPRCVELEFRGQPGLGAVDGAAVVAEQTARRSSPRRRWRR